MRLVEEYNESVTKEYLKGLYGKVTVSFNDIYNTLEVEKVANPTYGNGDKAQFLDFCGFFRVIPQGCGGDYTEYKNFLADRYNNGNYFLLSGRSDVPAKEQMIINVNTQDNAFDIVCNIRNKGEKFIHSIEFYGMANRGIPIPFNYDKIVVHYQNNNERNRQTVYDIVCSSGVSGDAFKKELSGFCHLYDNGSSKYYVGIRKEVASGTSFSTETSYAIQSVMTGKPLSYLKEHKEEQIPVLQSIINMDKIALSNLLFDAGKTVFEKYFKIEE